MCASEFDELLESIFCILLVVEVFFLQKVFEILEDVVVGCQEVRWIWQTKLCNPIRSTFEVLIVRCVVGHCHGKELTPFCWPVLSAGIEVFGASHLSPEHTSQLQCFSQNSESYSESDQQQTSKQWPWPFFSCKFGFGKCFGACSHFSHWASCHWLPYKAHFSLYVTIWLRNGSLLLCRIKEDNTSKWFF